MKDTLKRGLLILVGLLSLGLGTLGILLPVLPTTPFLLLSGYCFIRSSDRLYHWLIHHRIFGRYVYNYMTHKAVKKGTKTTALLFLWGSMLLTFLLLRRPLLIAMLALIGTGASLYILSLKNLEEPRIHVLEGRFTQLDRVPVPRTSPGASSKE